MTDGPPPADILKLNAWLKNYAAQMHATYVDYFTALVDEEGWLKDGVSNDGLHPNAEGYKIMVPLVDAAIQQTLRSRLQNYRVAIEASVGNTGNARDVRGVGVFPEARLNVYTT